MKKGKEDILPHSKDSVDTSKKDTDNKPTHDFLEQLALAWLLSKDIDNDQERKEKRVLNPESERQLLSLLEEEFGNGNLVSLILFGSAANGKFNTYSDYDFTVILKTASDNVAERETASPRLKRRLREIGLDELCAFNIYTQSEFDQADRENSWLIETMRKNILIVDSDDYVKNMMENKKDDVRQISSYTWSGIHTENPKHITEVSKRHKAAAQVLNTDFPNFSLYHTAEGVLGDLMAGELHYGIFSSRDSLTSIATRLNQTFDEPIDLEAIQQLESEQEINGKPSLYEINNLDDNLRAASILLENDLPFDALFHTYCALKSIYINELSEREIFVSGGELTQIFLREYSDVLPEDIINQIYQFSFKTEQFLGRTEYVSFDIGNDGKSIFAQQEVDDVSDLMEGLNTLISDFIKYKLEKPRHGRKEEK